MQTRPAWILGPLLLLTVSCVTVTVSQPAEPLPRPRDKHVTVRAYLQDGSPVIDETFHGTELLRPGDTISFYCRCDEGMEFSVTEPQFESDIELRHGKDDARRAGLEHAGQEPVQRPHPRRLLLGWRDPGFRPGDERIGPFTVGPIHRLSVWKFAWRVRTAGSPGSVKEWDPHLLGHPEIEY